MTTLTLICADQLSLSLSSLQCQDKSQRLLLFCEVLEEATHVPHHPKKIAFLFSAMRHFAKRCCDEGFQVVYRKLDDPDNSGSFKSEILACIQRFQVKDCCFTRPGDYRVFSMFESLKQYVPVTILEDTRFYSSPQHYAKWANGRKQCRMEYFYRDMRQRHDILMLDNKPVGGQWNYDHENRKALKKDLTIPPPLHFKENKITKEVLSLLEGRFEHHFGDLRPFYFATTSQEAQAVFDYFLAHFLPFYGDYQDAMHDEEPWLFHSHISFYLNCGLLLPKNCVQAAEDAYHQGRAPLNAVEGFIRQILGWREFIRGVYWQRMPAYKQENFFQAKRNLPSFFWTAKTDLYCLSTILNETKRFAYNHHIQRLMVLGNFLLLLGVKPLAVQAWYLAVYADAYEWVELPNVMGMILFADGGYFASKPYIASGAYINRMSNYCKKCSYSVKEKWGPKACPFNYLYWNFIAEHEETFAKNPRMSMMIRTYHKMTLEQKEMIAQQSQTFIKEVTHV